MVHYEDSSNPNIIEIKFLHLKDLQNIDMKESSIQLVIDFVVVKLYKGEGWSEEDTLLNEGNNLFNK
jgi:hypothetical protein